MKGSESISLNLGPVRDAQLAYLDTVYASWVDPAPPEVSRAAESSGAIKADIYRGARLSSGEGFRRSRREWPYR